jgi:hypothetical protein
LCITRRRRRRWRSWTGWCARSLVRLALAALRGAYSITEGKRPPATPGRAAPAQARSIGVAGRHLSTTVVDYVARSHTTTILRGGVLTFGARSPTIQHLRSSPTAEDDRERSRPHGAASRR